MVALGSGSGHVELRRLRRMDVSHLSERVRPRLRTGGVPPALRDHLVHATADLAEAEALGVGLLGPHHIRVGEPDRPDLHVSWHAVRLRDVTLGHLDFGAPVEVEVSGAPEPVLLLLPLSGSAVVSGERGEAEATPIRAVMPGAGR